MRWPAADCSADRSLAAYGTTAGRENVNDCDEDDALALEPVEADSDEAEW